MMSNLFSIFDTSTSMIFNFNWMTMIINIFMLPMSFWFLPSKFIFLYYKLNIILFYELKSILLNKFNSLNSIFFLSMFLIILMNNMMGLFPYIFTCSSHMIFSLSFSLPFWLNLMIFSILNNLNFMFSHLIPQGTPFILMPFMVMIETISNIIRPMTLMIRLTANMMAGHLLLKLLSELATIPSNLLMSNFIIVIQIMLLILEYSVSFIQSYVFMMLMSLYMKEIN